MIQEHPYVFAPPNALGIEKIVGAVNPGFPARLSSHLISRTADMGFLNKCSEIAEKQITQEKRSAAFHHELVKEPFEKELYSGALQTVNKSWLNGEVPYDHGKLIKAEETLATYTEPNNSTMRKNVLVRLCEFRPKGSMWAANQHLPPDRTGYLWRLCPVSINELVGLVSETSLRNERFIPKWLRDGKTNLLELASNQLPLDDNRFNQFFAERIGNDNLTLGSIYTFCEGDSSIKPPSSITVFDAEAAMYNIQLHENKLVFLRNFYLSQAWGSSGAPFARSVDI